MDVAPWSTVLSCKKCFCILTVFEEDVWVKIDCVIGKLFVFCENCGEEVPLNAPTNVLNWLASTCKKIKDGK